MTEQERPAPPSDEELVRRYKAGSSHGLDELWRRYQRRLFLFVRRKVGADQDAEDIVQETFLKALRYLDRYDEVHRFSGWIYTVCRQQVVAHWRRRRPDPLTGDLPQTAAGPAEAAERDSLRERLWQAASALPPKQFDVVWLRYVEEMHVAEVARSLAISGISVRVLLHRARQALVRKVAEENAPGENVGIRVSEVMP